MLSKKFVFFNFNNKTKKTLINKLKEELKLFILANLNNSDFYNCFAISGDDSLKYIYRRRFRF